MFTQLSQHRFLNSAKVGMDTRGLLGGQDTQARLPERGVGGQGRPARGPRGLLTPSLHIHQGPAVGPALSQRRQRAGGREACGTPHKSDDDK